MPDRLVVVLSVALALALRLPRMKIAYWGDEAISVGIASRPIPQIPHYLRADGSPPLYYVLLHYWMRQFGTSVVATHTLSLLFSLAAIPVAWWCCRALFGPKPARLAAFLAAVSPWLAYYGTETRMYALVAVLAMLAVTGFVRAYQVPPGPAAVQRPTLREAIRPARGWFVLAVVASALLTYTHNWGLFLVGGLTTAGALGAWRHRDLVRWWRTLVYVMVVALAYLPWVPNLLEQITYTGAPWSARPSIASLVLTPLNTWFSGASSGIEILEFFHHPRVDVGFLLPWLAAVGIGVSVLALWLRGRPERSHPVMGGSASPASNPGGLASGLTSSPLLLAAVAVALTVAAGWCASQLVRAWAARYLSVAIAPLIVIVPGAVHRFGLVRRVVAVAVCFMMLAAVPVLLDPPGAVATKSNVAVVDAAMRPELSRGDVVITADMSALPVIAYYLPPGLRYATPLGPVADPHVVDWVNLTSRLARTLPQTTLRRLLASLPVRAKILLVNPTNWVTVGAPPSYTNLIKAEGIMVNQLLLNSPNFTVIKTVQPRHARTTGNPVVGILLRKDASS